MNYIKQIALYLEIENPFQYIYTSILIYLKEVKATCLKLKKDYQLYRNKHVSSQENKLLKIKHH